MGVKDRNSLIDQIVDDSAGRPKQKQRIVRARQRTRHDARYEVPFRTWHTFHADPPYGGTTYFEKLSNFFTRFEQINDVTGDRGGEHHVDHVICTSTCGSRVSFRYLSPDGLQSGGSDFGPWENVEFTHIHSVTPLVEASSLGDQATRAIKRATELFPTVVLFPNFLWELKDWRNLPEIIRNLGKRWDTFNSYQSLRSKSLARYRLYLQRPDVKKELLSWITGKRLANGFLAKEFGLDPFLSDVKKLFSILSDMEKRLVFLKKTMGKQYRMGHREELTMPSGLANPIPHGVTTLECEFYRATVNFSFVVSHNLSDLDSLRSRIGLLMAALGIDKPAAILWEAVPYSFLVDWFANVQDILETVKVNPFISGEITIHKVSTSVTQRASFGHYINVYGNQKTLLDRYHIKRHWREPGLPSKSYVTLKAELTDNQLLLVAALLRQRLK